MEKQPEGGRLSRVRNFIVDHLRFTPESEPKPYRPSAQRDVGKSAVEAAKVSLVIQGMQPVEKSQKNP